MNGYPPTTTAMGYIPPPPNNSYPPPATIVGYHAPSTGFGPPPPPPQRAVPYNDGHYRPMGGGPYPPGPPPPQYNNHSMPMQQPQMPPVSYSAPPPVSYPSYTGPAPASAPYPVATLAPGQPPVIPEPNKICRIENGWRYELVVVQQPQRARMCGFGDKDRRPITPPPCVKLIITNVTTGKERDPNEIEHTLFVLHVDLWSADGTKELNLVRSSHPAASTIGETYMASYAETISSTTSTVGVFRQENPGSVQQARPYNPYPGPPQVNPYAGAPSPPSQSYSGPPQYQRQHGHPSNGPYYPPQNAYSQNSYSQNGQPQNGQPQNGYSQNSYPQNGYTQNGYPQNGYSQNGYPPSGPPQQPPMIVSGAGIHAMGQSSSQHGQPPSVPSQDQAYKIPRPPANHSNTAPQGMFTRNLIGSTAASAQRLTDPDDRIGIWFVLQDLSVRTEGIFRLRFSFVNVAAMAGAAMQQLQPPSNLPGGTSMVPMTQVNTNKALVLAQVFSEDFQVYSAKRFPGVVESTPLSKCFATQGVKIPIRKEGANKSGNKDDDDEY